VQDIKNRTHDKEELFNKYWFGPGSYSSCSILAFESEKRAVNSIMDTETLYLKMLRVFSASWKSWLFRS
jgi:hypothetical protein